MVYLIRITCEGSASAARLDGVLKRVLPPGEYVEITGPEGLLTIKDKLRGQVCIFTVSLGPGGMNEEYRRLIAALYTSPQLLEGVCGGIVIDGPDELFTKKIGRELLFIANRAGCLFPGKPLVEATGSLRNFNVQARLLQSSPAEAYKTAVEQLVGKAVALTRKPREKFDKQHLLVLHASSRATSNTLLLWKIVRSHLSRRTEIEEISLRNGELVDCRGCSYETCLHFGEKGDCFYGGLIVDQVYPAVKKCHALLLICPNYNDAVGANMTAFFNRLTALFRTDFKEFASKRVYALVVSGYSGGDIVAEQIADTMSCNKNFILPPHFALVETANEPRSILACPGIKERAAAMAARIEGDFSEPACN